MLLTKNRTVRSLEEDLKDIGIDGEKFAGRVDHMTGLMEERSDGGRWKGAPPIARYGYGPQGSAHVDEERELSEVEGDPDAEPLEEARVTAARSKAERRKAKKAAKKKRREDPMAHKMKIIKGRTASAKRSRQKSRKRVDRAVNKKRQAALHRAGRRVMTRGFDGQPANEEIESILESDDDFQAALAEQAALPKQTAFSEAASNVSEIAMRFAEIFGLVEEAEVAAAMEDLRESAEAFYEEVEGVEELDESQEVALKAMVSKIGKAIRFYEGLGSPSLTEACEYHAFRLQEGISEDVEEVDVDEDLGDPNLEEVEDDDEGGAPGNGELAEV